MRPTRRDVLIGAAAGAGALALAEWEAEAAPGVAELGPWRYGRGSYARDTLLMFRGNPPHTFYGTGPIPDAPRLVWKFRTAAINNVVRGKPMTWAGAGWTGTASKLGNYVYVASAGGYVYCFEAMTGRLVWQYRGGGMFKSSVCIYDNMVYVGNTDNLLHCIDAATGRRSGPSTRAGTSTPRPASSTAASTSPARAGMRGRSTRRRGRRSGARSSAASGPARFPAPTARRRRRHRRRRALYRHLRRRPLLDRHQGRQGALEGAHQRRYRCLSRHCRRVRVRGRRGTGVSPLLLHPRHRQGGLALLGQSQGILVDARLRQRPHLCRRRRYAPALRRCQERAGHLDLQDGCRGMVVPGGGGRQGRIRLARRQPLLRRCSLRARDLARCLGRAHNASPCIVGGYIWIGSATGWIYCFGP